MTALFAISGITQKIMLAAVRIIFIRKDPDRFFEKTPSELDGCFLTFFPVTPSAIFSLIISLGDNPS